MNVGKKDNDTSEIRTHAPEGTALAGLRDNHSAIVPHTRQDVIVDFQLSIKFENLCVLTAIALPAKYQALQTSPVTDTSV